jgi:D-tyrosyl-tRNA(Tyr) deacylase
MRALLQRVTHAKVDIDGRTVGEIGPGLCVLLGVGPTDTSVDAEKLWNKIKKLRIFDDEEHHMNRSLLDTGGSALVVSQFTLYADTRHGNRPGFSKAAAPQLADELYLEFCEIASADTTVATGVFGADMQVSLTNDGPITIWLDTDDFGSRK